MRRLGIVKTGLALVLIAALLPGISPAGRSTGQALSSMAAPLSDPADTLRFAVIGDYGQSGVPERDVASLVKGWNPDFVITTGDNNYPDGAASTIDPNVGYYYHEFIHPYTGIYGQGASSNRFFPSLGNHDWNTANAQPYLAYFALPGNERYYDFVWGPIHFFAIDGDSREPDGITSDSTQADWLRSGLAASTTPWQVVYMHHPPYSSGPHGSTPELQWPYKAWGADAILTGHDHTYERIVVDDLPYFVNGLGGKSKYSFGVPVPGSEVRYNADYGAMLVVANGDSITFKFVSRAGSLIDTYTINKSPGCLDRLGDTSCDDLVNDPDDDGCGTSEEQGMGAYFDGTPTGWFDVYDVPVPARADAEGANGTRNDVVDTADALAILFYAFSEPTGVCADNPNGNGVDYDCVKGVDLNGDGTNDIPEPLHQIEEGLKYDRSPGARPDPVTGIDPAGPPDGVIDIGDVLVALAQAFVVNCSM